MSNLKFSIKEKTANISYRTPYARLTLILAGLMIVLSLSGAVLANSNDMSCSGWPVCNEGWAPLTAGTLLSMFHRLTVAVSGLVLLILFLRAWQTQRNKTVILVSATAAFVLFISQALLGARLVNDFPVYMIYLHRATAVTVWGVFLIQVIAVGFQANTKEEERWEAEEFSQRKGMLVDILMLTKPIVVALLLVTTFAGMVIGARAWPAFPVAFWTLIGGFLAAGGSGAINQYIDRFDDLKMQRTQKRPIPSGRLTAGEGLAVGVAMTITSFFVMVAFVNLTAALLSLAGIVYYVLLYSILLKKTTIQNIVIGGGAGAIPPLVGWAASTGSLNIPSLFLFAVVFMWTPPHFWALALVRRKDYARAGVPMLPVIRGEKETRKQVLVYTIELVLLTLLLPVFNLGGSIYLIGASILGAWLLMAAINVWRKGGNKLAWKMYRYSSMYLAFLFIVLMVDRLM